MSLNSGGKASSRSLRGRTQIKMGTVGAITTGAPVVHRPTEWRKHPDANGFLQEAIRSNLDQAHSLFADAAPRLAERLIALGLDERVKGYTAVSAISEAFKILQQGVVDREHRDQLKAIRSTLEQIEGQTPSVVDI